MKYPNPPGLTSSMRATLALLIACSAASAAEIEVTVLDRHGEPVPNVAVYIKAEQESELPAAVAQAQMRQVDFRFEPDLLVVQTGTRVRFVNNDTVAHHVYSFSAPNDFVLPMFKSGMQPEVRFAHDGAVVVGCNLHDRMVGHILVVDSTVFGKTGQDGQVRLETDNPGGLAVNIWSPGLGQDYLAQRVKAGRSAQLTFLLREELRTKRDSELETLSWKRDRK